MSENTVTQGSTVVLHYRGTLEDGTEFDSSHQRGEPMTVLAGAGQLITGFDQELLGMASGETKTFTVEPAEAYGDRDETAKVTLEKTVFPEDFEFTAGMTVPLQGPNGQPFLATLSEPGETTVEADLNHPMAGKSLTFEVEVLEVREETN